MKKYFKKLPVFIAVFAALICSVFAFPASAAEFSNDVIYELMNVSSLSYDKLEFNDGSFAQSTSAIISLCFAESSGVDSSLPQLPTGNYVVLAPEYSWPNIGANFTPAEVVLYHSEGVSYLPFGEVFHIDGANSDFFYVQSPNGEAAPLVYRVDDAEPPAPLYQSAWDLLVKYIYGEGTPLTPYQQLTVTIFATFLAIACVAAPFLLCYWIFFRGCRI